jgi:hypothetical protein
VHLTKYITCIRFDEESEEFRKRVRKQNILQTPDKFHYRIIASFQHTARPLGIVLMLNGVKTMGRLSALLIVLILSSIVTADSAYVQSRHKRRLLIVVDDKARGNVRRQQKITQADEKVEFGMFDDHIKPTSHEENDPIGDENPY